MEKSKIAPGIEKAGKVKVKIKNTPAVHIHTPKPVILKTGKAKSSGKSK